MVDIFAAAAVAIVAAAIIVVVGAAFADDVIVTAAGVWDRETSFVIQSCGPASAPEAKNKTKMR